MDATRLDILFILLCLAVPIGLILGCLCAWLERNRPMATRLPKAEQRPALLHQWRASDAAGNTLPDTADEYTEVRRNG